MMPESEEVAFEQENIPDTLPPMETIKRLLSYVTGKYKVLLGIVIICLTASAVLVSLTSYLTKDLIDGFIDPLVVRAINYGEDAVQYTELLNWIFSMAILYILSILADYVSARVMIRISTHVLFDVRRDMFKHMQKLPISFFDTHPYGDLMSRYTNDVDALEGLISQGFPITFSSCVTIISSIYFMFKCSWQMTIPILVVTCVLMFFIGRIGGKSAQYFINQQESIGDVDGYIEEMVSGQKVAKVFTYEKRSKEIFDKKNEELCKNTTTANKYISFMMPLTNSLSLVLNILIVLLGGFLAIECGVSVITVGVITSYIRLTGDFIQPVSSVTGLMSSINMAIAGAGRVFQLMDETPEIDDGYVTLVHCRKFGDELVEVAETEIQTRKYNDEYVWAWKHPHSDGTLTYTELRGDVELVDVDFSYDGKKQVLHDVSLYAEPGEKIAFVGATGAGKTTISNLINRFYDVDDGIIRFDFIDINKIKKADLRKSMGIVLQETNLFTGTVMDNIRYGNLKASDEECIRAAKLANAHDFISKLPQGYNTVLTSNGSELSQGQRQLVAIARAAVADPPVMIMDEATSSIDTRTEALVQQGMDALMEGRTVFVIAHRLSTVKNSDAIMVMENGQIIECGDHNYLIDIQGKYYQLYTGAFELE